MPYEVTEDEAAGIVVVCVRGEATSDEHMNARKEAARLCQTHGYLRLLVDLRDLKTREVLSTAGLYEFGASYEKDGVPAHCRIAHVFPRDKAAREDVGFTTTVALNRGVLIGEFDTVEEARGWLLGAREATTPK
jgi:hypothetical protein